MLQKALDLVGDYLSVEIAIEKRDLLDEWPQVTLFHLLRSREALASIRVVSEHNLYGSAIVLHRYIFELAVNVKYISNDVENRLAEYLKHSRIPSDIAEVEEIDERLRNFQEQEDHSAITELLLPGRSWKNLKDMCEEIGCLDDYFTMYRSASELAHGGGHGIGAEILNLLGEKSRPSYEFPGILLGATLYYGWVVQISCRVFPYLEEAFQQMRPDWPEDLATLIQQIGEAVKAERHEKYDLWAPCS